MNERMNGSEVLAGMLERASKKSNGSITPGQQSRSTSRLTDQRTGHQAGRPLITSDAWSDTILFSQLNTNFFQMLFLCLHNESSSAVCVWRPMSSWNCVTCGLCGFIPTQRETREILDHLQKSTISLGCRFCLELACTFRIASNKNTLGVFYFMHCNVILWSIPVWRLECY